MLITIPIETKNALLKTFSFNTNQLAWLSRKEEHSWMGFVNGQTILCLSQIRQYVEDCLKKEPYIDVNLPYDNNQGSIRTIIKISTITAVYPSIRNLAEYFGNTPMLGRPGIPIPQVRFLFANKELILEDGEMIKDLLKALDIKK